jgi:trehalose 6-phosphate phosphatase
VPPSTPASALPALKALAAARERAGIFTDFDGTLSPIVEDPAEAKPVRGTKAVLEALARRFAVVAVVSGRPVLDLAHRIRPRGVRLVGIHGLEVLDAASVSVAPPAEAARAAVEAVAASLLSSLRGMRGVSIERKGLALAVHFRRAPDPDEAERLAAPLVSEAAAAAGLVVVPGRRVLEVRPAGGGDKGDAVRRIAASANLDAALVAGDDVGDIPAFEALAGLDPLLRVAVASAESPPGLAAAADLVVEEPAAFVAVLRTLARLDASDPPGSHS